MQGIGRRLFLFYLLAILPTNQVDAQDEPHAPVPERGINFSYPPDLRERIGKALARASDWIRQDAAAAMAARQKEADEIEDPFERGTVPWEAVGTSVLLSAAALAQHGRRLDEPWILEILDRAGSDVAKHRATSKGRGWGVEEVSLYLYLVAVYHSPSDPFEAPIDSRGMPHPIAVSVPIPPERKQTVMHAAQELVEVQVPPSSDARRSGGWGHGRTGFQPLISFDRSYVAVRETRLALVGLTAAEQLGVQVPLRTWIAALEGLLRWQEESTERTRTLVIGPPSLWTGEGPNAVRGFCQWPPPTMGGPTPMWTANGVLAVALCRAALLRRGALSPEEGEASRRAVGDGLAWLQTHWTMDADKATGRRTFEWEEAFGFAYFPLIRWLGSVLQLTRIGGRDWYADGAKLLLSRQRHWGGWGDRKYSNEAREATAHAILFLTRERQGLRGKETTPPK